MPILIAAAAPVFSFFFFFFFFYFLSFFSFFFFFIIFVFRKYTGGCSEVDCGVGCTGKQCAST